MALLWLQRVVRASLFAFSVLSLLSVAQAQGSKKTTPETSTADADADHEEQRSEWFLRGRVIPGKSSAELRHRAYQAKMQARAARLEAGKDFGAVHFTDGPLRITADTPKRVAWDQAALADFAQRIAATGDKVADFIDIDYSISESRFNAWPTTLKETFAKARTVKPGKTNYRLALAQENLA